MGFEYKPPSTSDSGKLFMLGEHNARLAALEEKTEAIGEDVKKILAFVERSRGSWKTLVALATAGAAVFEAGHWLFQFFHRGP